MTSADALWRCSSSIDGLRGVSIMLVMAYHAGLSFAVGGFIGVDIFFVLSGFLITNLLIREWQCTAAVSLTAFYARRALRLLPGLSVVLTAAIATPTLFMGLESTSWKVVLIVLCYMANWHLARDVGSLGTLTHTWSLSIEEQFYLLWPPLLVFMLRRMDRRWIVVTVGFGVIAVWLERVVLFVVFDALQPRLYYGTDTRADGLLLGCLVGLLSAWGMLPSGERHGRWLRAAGMAAFATLLFVAYRGRIETDVALGWSIPASLAASVLLVSLLTAPPRPVTWLLEQKTLTLIGRISYGLYLWHVPVFHGFLRADRMAALGLVGFNLHLVRFAAAFALAAMSFIVVERPMLKLKNRFRDAGQPRRTAAAELAVG